MGLFAPASQQIRFRQSLRDPAMRATLLVFFAFFAAQGAFWNHSRAIMPEMTIVPDVPGERTLHAMSFGDEEAFFRLHALNLQNSGDTFGRFTALYKYDYNKLYHWFTVLGTFDNQSNYLPSMAAYYYSQTQNPNQIHYMVDYLDEYGTGRVKEKWWWLVQASYLADHKMNDSARALEIAEKMADVRGIPIWAQQLPAFIHEQRGEFGDALAIMEGVMKHPEDYNQGELNFMRYFVDERLHRLKEVEGELDEMQKEKDEMKAKGIKDPKPMGPPPDVGAPTLGG